MDHSHIHSILRRYHLTVRVALGGYMSHGIFTTSCRRILFISQPDESNPHSLTRYSLSASLLAFIMRNVLFCSSFENLIVMSSTHKRPLTLNKFRRSHHLFENQCGTLNTITALKGPVGTRSQRRAYKKTIWLPKKSEPARHTHASTALEGQCKHTRACAAIRTTMLVF